MKLIIKCAAVAILYLMFSACEVEFTPEVADDPPQLVVEGFIEAGADPQPTFVTLTRTVPFFSEIGQETFNNIYVHDAKVTITSGDQTWELVEFCWADLPPEVREQVLELAGIAADSIPFNSCVYVDPTFQLTGEYGRQYDLRIEVEDKVLTASTTIPPHVPIDSIFFVDLPVDSLSDWKEVQGFISDPANQQNFYRYFTAVNSNTLRAPVNSVIDDAFFNGQSFDFPLAKAESRDSSVDFELYGLYRLQDTVKIKWTNIDEAHYRFWNSYEYNVVNQGPFSSYTVIDTNVDGGLGVWGGYSFSEYEFVVK